MKQENILVVIDSDKSEMIYLVDGIQKVSFPIGEKFLKFLEFDFDEYLNEDIYADEQFLEENYEEMIVKDALGISRPGESVADYMAAIRRYHTGCEHVYFECTNSFDFLEIMSNYSHFTEETLPNAEKLFWAEMKKLQENMKKAMEFCLDYDKKHENYMNDPAVRFWHGRSQNRFNFPIECYKAEIKFFPDINPAALMVLDDISNTGNTNIIKKKDIDRMGKVFSYGISAVNPFNIVLAEFSHMIDLKIWVRKCEICGKYFILGKRTNTKFCDRIRPGSSLPCCKDRKAIKKLKLKEGTVGKAKLDAENRMYGMLNRNYDVNKDEIKEEIKRIVKTEKNEAEVIRKLDEVARVERKSK